MLASCSNQGCPDARRCSYAVPSSWALVASSQVDARCWIDECILPLLSPSQQCSNSTCLPFPGFKAQMLRARRHQRQLAYGRCPWETHAAAGSMHMGLRLHPPAHAGTHATECPPMVSGSLAAESPQATKRGLPRRLSLESDGMSLYLPVATWRTWHPRTCIWDMLAALFARICMCGRAPMHTIFDNAAFNCFV